MEVIMNKYLMLAMIALLIAPMSVGANDDDDGWMPLKTGSISFRVGGFFPNGESDIWNENLDNLTFEMSDFNGATAGVEFNWFASRFLTVGFAIDFYRKTVGTEYRDFVDTSGASIFQDLTLEVTPITVTVKFTPLGNGSPGYGGERGSPIVPWVGAGVGVYAFTYEEAGEFIDFSDLSIIDGPFIAEEETGFGVHVAGGLMVPIGLDWDVFGEARYSIVEGDLGDDFVGFDPIDLGGFSFHFGASYRF